MNDYARRYINGWFLQYPFPPMKDTRKVARHYLPFGTQVIVRAPLTGATVLPDAHL